MSEYVKKDDVLNLLKDHSSYQHSSTYVDSATMKKIEGISCDGVPAKDAIEYCERSAEVALRMREKSLKPDEKDSPSLIAYQIMAEQYFEQEYCRWKYDVPNMIKALSDGTWKEHFEEEQDEPSR